MIISRTRRLLIRTTSSSSDCSVNSTSSTFLKRPFHSLRASKSKNQLEVPLELASPPKQVSFNEGANIVHTGPSDYDETVLWYSKNDIQLIKKGNSITAQQKRRGSFQETEDSTFLGLEHYLCRTEIRIKRDEMYDAVLGEQARQQARTNSKTVNPDRIARAYQKALVRAR